MTHTESCPVSLFVEPSVNAGSAGELFRSKHLSVELCEGG